jgi:hypothetical protein
MMANWLAFAALVIAVPAIGQEAPAPGADARIAPAYEPPEDPAVLAQQLANPVASLISVPIQFNFDGDIGPKVNGARDGSRITMNVQPVIPFRLGEDWNLISRTIVPLVWQKDVFPGSGSQFGLSDTVQSLFLSPARPKGIVWGVGPVLLVPTGTDDLLSTRKWGAGPSALLLNQSGPWTLGLLANQVWSYAGNSNRADVSQMLVNPFVTYATPRAFTVAVAADIVRDWEGKRWTVPVIFNASQVTRVGGQLMQIGGGLRYYVATNEFAPHGFAARFTVTLLFPR